MNSLRQFAINETHSTQQVRDIGANTILKIMTLVFSPRNQFGPNICRSDSQKLPIHEKTIILLQSIAFGISFADFSIIHE
jgi:hypothetical protein